MQEHNELMNAYQIEKDVSSSSVMALWKKFLQGRSSFLIFLDNSKRLRNSIKMLNSVQISQLESDDRWRLQRMIVGDLHNTISSGQNFIDHLKHTHNFNESVHEKTNSVFFRELRNYLVHNDSFYLVTRNEYKKDHSQKFYQAMDKTTFVEFVNKKAITILDKQKVGKTEISKRESDQLREFNDLLNFLDEQEKSFNFEPFLNNYIISLNIYYSKWVTKFLMKEVKLSELKEFEEKIKVVNRHFLSSLSESRLRYLRLAIYKKTKFIPKGRK